MSDTLDWICNEIGARKELILSKRREREVVSKRWTIFYFFHLLGKSTVWIGNLFNCDHSPVYHCIRVINDADKNRAIEAYKKYHTEVKGRDISELTIEVIEQKITLKVPNYKTGAIEFREIPVSEYEKKQKRRVGYWWQRKF